jgi:hypothetical protein
VDDASTTIAAVATVWLVLTLGMAAWRCFKPQLIDLDGQLIAIALAAGGFVIYIFLLDIQVKAGALPAFFVFGALIGFAVSFLAGYQNIYGLAVFRGSGWFLIPWGISAIWGFLGALEGDADSIAIGVSYSVLALGIGTGQFLYSWRAVVKVEAAPLAPIPISIEAPDSPGLAVAASPAFVAPALRYPPPALTPEPAPAPEPTPVPAMSQCPNGHTMVDATDIFCDTCGVRALCPNGHRLGRAGLSFCTTCGVALT